MSLIDTHCHIYYDNFKNDFNEVLERAQKNNIKKIICVGVDIESSMESIQLAEKHEMIYASVGYHPHESKEANNNYLDQLELMLNHKKVVALGEIGLDFHYNHSEKETQIKIFKEQLILAKTMNKPVIVHNRNSDDELLKCIIETKSSKGVVHCFASNFNFAKKLFKEGYYISFTGLVTFAKDLIDVVENTPLDSFMIETDAPYLTPKPHRGKRNEPSMVKIIAEKIAKIKDMDISANETATTANAKNLFGF